MMEMLNEIDMSVVTTTTSSSDCVEYSASSNAKTSGGENDDHLEESYLSLDKENSRAHETNVDHSADGLLQYESGFMGENSGESFCEYNCSETEVDDACEELVMMVPDLDSTLKFKHDAERFFMTLSIAEAELDLAKSASRTSRIAMGDDLDISSQGGASCLKEIRSYVEELLETVNDVRDSNFGVQRVVEECSDILQQSVSQSDFSQVDTTDMNAISDHNMVSVEKLKLLCEAVSEENSRLRKEVDILSREREFLTGRVSDLDESSGGGAASTVGGESYRYFRRSPVMRFFFFIFVLAIFSPGDNSRGAHSGSRHAIVEQQSSSSAPLDLSSGHLPKDGALKLLQESLKGLEFGGSTSREGQPDGAISICSILSELDVLEKCFTRIRLS